MIINEIIGNTESIDLGSRSIDFLQLQWYESTKRIQRKTTQGGMELAIRFLGEGQRLKQNDILFMDDAKAVVVDILPSDAIVVSPRTMLEMGRVCYEIGNKHLPIFIQNDQVLIPYEGPIFHWLVASGYQAEKKHTKLLNLISSNVQPHSHGSEGGSLFSKIMGMVAKPES